MNNIYQKCDNPNKLINRIKKYGPVAVFLFFLIKGLVWLSIPFFMWIFS